jgi:hypothetical protein
MFPCPPRKAPGGPDFLRMVFPIQVLVNYKRRTCPPPGCPVWYTLHYPFMFPCPPGKAPGGPDFLWMVFSIQVLVHYISRGHVPPPGCPVPITLPIHVSISSWENPPEVRISFGRYFPYNSWFTHPAGCTSNRFRTASRMKWA